MSSSHTLLDLVDSRNLRRLFVEELGWNNPDRSTQIITASDTRPYTFDQVASYHGLRVWHCPSRPPARVQRELDHVLSKESYERLVIFSDEHRQDWRWPRRSDTTGANARLLTHPHTVGEYDPNLLQQLQAITISMDDEPSLAQLLAKMRAAFDQVAESASVRAARHMRTLYRELSVAGISDEHATLLLARLLFLLFGDDSGMWVPQPADQFYDWLVDHTTAGNLHVQLRRLFDAVDRPETDRDVPANDPLSTFRHINGGLFRDPLPLSELTASFRDGLIDACTFDWQVISPAVFGSMFQTVKNKVDRRAGGEHYTTEENILRTINPLFLDECRERLRAAWDNKAQLTRLHKYLGGLRVLDPACGCGNFLVVAYRELRAVELELLKRRRYLDERDHNVSGRAYSQTSIDVTDDLKVTLDHFYGIEINAWPARIAETALLLVDHLANQQMAEEFGTAPDRLPIEIAPTIVQANAIRADWRDVLGLPPDASVDDLIIVGNPPFHGMARLSPEQQQDNRYIFTKLNLAGLRSGRMDYVACWYAKTIELLRGSSGRAAFVSTNSITQGEQARTLVPLLGQTEMKIDFAHRTFKWDTEGLSADTAQVTVVIVGFSSTRRATNRRLFDYHRSTGSPEERRVATINAYLVDGPDVAPIKVSSPLVEGMPHATQGSKPVDGRENLILKDDALDEARADPIASRYLRPFMQTTELLKNQPRWCLWLVNASARELTASPFIATRLARVRSERLKSPTPSVQAFASKPQLFTQNRQPATRYIALPEVSSENRRWIPGTFLEPDVIAGNKLILWLSDKLWHLGYLQSSLYMGWVRAYCGRMKIDFSLSPGLIYFPFPFVTPTATQQQDIEAATEALLAERIRLGATLYELYRPELEPHSLLARHAELDRVIDSLYGLTDPTEGERMRVVMERYAKLISAGSPGSRRRGVGRKC